MPGPQNQRGQGLLEAVLALPIFIAAGLFLGLLLYREMVYFFADYHLHEALICSEDASSVYCKDELAHRLKPLLRSHSVRVSIKKFANQTEGAVFVDLSPPLTIKKYLRRARL